MLSVDSRTVRFMSKMGARGVLGQAVLDIANDGTFFYIVTADLARASGFERFTKEYPDRIINTGIAEANMLGVASGLASSGIPVIATTWATFASSRVADQARNYMGFMHSNVKLIGMDSGFTNNRFGYSHTNGPDIAIMSTIPNVVVLAPSDGFEIYYSIKAALEHNGPVYIRLTGNQILPIIHKDADYSFSIGEPEILSDGRDIVFISNGVVLSIVLNVAEKLKEDGFSCKVLNYHTVKPKSTQFIDKILSSRLIVTVEEHSEYGGIGSDIASSLAGLDKHPPLEMIHSKDGFTPSGGYEYALKYNGIDEESIYARVIRRMGII